MDKTEVEKRLNEMENGEDLVKFMANLLGYEKIDRKQREIANGFGLTESIITYIRRGYSGRNDEKKNGEKKIYTISADNAKKLISNISEKSGIEMPVIEKAIINKAIKISEKRFKKEKIYDDLKNDSDGEFIDAEIGKALSREEEGKQEETNVNKYETDVSNNNDEELQELSKIVKMKVQDLIKAMGYQLDSVTESNRIQNAVSFKVKVEDDSMQIFKVKKILTRILGVVLNEDNYTNMKRYIIERDAKPKGMIIVYCSSSDVLDKAFEEHWKGLNNNIFLVDLSQERKIYVKSFIGNRMDNECIRLMQQLYGHKNFVFPE